MWVLITEPGSSIRSTSAFNCTHLSSPMSLIFITMEINKNYFLHLLIYIKNVEILFLFLSNLKKIKCHLPVIFVFKIYFHNILISNSLNYY